MWASRGTPTQGSNGDDFVLVGSDDFEDVGKDAATVAGNGRNGLGAALLRGPTARRVLLPFGGAARRSEEHSEPVGV
jgi:hypothetical protein